MKDLIERQDAIDALYELYEYMRAIDPSEAADLVRQGVFLAEKKIENLPSTQPEPVIPISWIEEEIKRLESRKSSFAVLDAVQLKALIKRWESEQNETD